MMSVARNVLLHLMWLIAGLFFSIFGLLAIIVGLLKGPISYLRPKPHPRPTETMTRPELGVHSTVHANGLDFHCVTSGSGSELLLLLHGFPENWYSWRFQLTDPAMKARFTMVAVDMRGYGDSSKPSGSWFGSRHYHMRHCVEDVRQLITALGRSKCAIMSHDFGGAVAWQFAARHPDMLTHLCVCNCPHPRSFQRNWSFAQAGKSWYMFFFQLLLLPEIFMRGSDFGFLDAAFRSKRYGPTRRDAFSDDDIEVYKHYFSQPGAVTAAINYYRQLPTMSARVPPILTPTLVVWGTNDKALGTPLTRGMATDVPNCTLELLDGVSHWTPVDAPAAVCTRFLSWHAAHASPGHSWADVAKSPTAAPAAAAVRQRRR